MSEKVAPTETSVDTHEDDGFGEFTLAAAPKPIAGVTDVEIPARLAEHLAREVPLVLANTADKELLLTARDKETAQRLGAYAKAWGARQERKLYIHKIANTK